MGVIMKVKVKADTRQLINQAWVRNGDSYITGEPLILALLLHTTGVTRAGNDFKVIQELMNDVNLTKE